MHVVYIASLTWVLALEVSFALQSGWQLVQAQRQLAFKRRVFLAESRETTKRALAHKLLEGRVTAWDDVWPACLGSFYLCGSAFWRRGVTWWHCRDGAHFCTEDVQTFSIY